MKPTNLQTARRRQRKASKDVINALIDFFEEQNSDYTFETQEQLSSVLEDFLTAKGKLKEEVKGPHQTTISRAMPEVIERPYLKGKKYFFIEKSYKGYYFAQKDSELTDLFKLRNAYLKQSVHVMSENTIVFCINNDKHQKFIQVLHEHFPTDMLWGYSSLGNYLYLMFDTKQNDWKAYFNVFRFFFENMREYKIRQKEEQKAKAERQRLADKYGNLPSGGSTISF